MANQKPFRETNVTLRRGLILINLFVLLFLFYYFVVFTVCFFFVLRQTHVQAGDFTVEIDFNFRYGICHLCLLRLYCAMTMERFTWYYGLKHKHKRNMYTSVQNMDGLGHTSGITFTRKFSSEVCVCVCVF